MTKSRRSQARAPSSTPKRVFSNHDMARIQKAVAGKHDGQVPKGSYVGRIQRVVAKRAG